MFEATNDTLSRQINVEVWWSASPARTQSLISKKLAWKNSLVLKGDCGAGKLPRNCLIHGWEGQHNYKGPGSRYGDFRSYTKGRSSSGC
jgi:hypothetical protein